MTNRPTVSVLGLGRMGSAMATLLVEAGFPVLGWSRSGTSVPPVATVTDTNEAVREADVVLLALFDGAACRDVLNRCLDAIPPDAVVVNTATVLPRDAQDLERMVLDRGRDYLHCPVIGSVPAVRRGALTLLVGAPETSGAGANVLAALGEQALVEDAASAATLKLVANSVLADGTFVLARAIARGRRLGLDHARVLDVLERSTLGRLAAAKRTVLEGRVANVDFTAGALIKDVDLLASIDPASTYLARQLAAATVAPDSDVAVIATRLAHGEHARIDALSHLHAAPGVDTDGGVLAPLISYARGHASGDPAHFRAAFRPTAHVEGMREGAFVSWDLETYCANFSGQPAADEGSRVRTVTSLSRTGSVATAEMVLAHGTTTFTDQFLLVEEDGTWAIANKVYHREN